MYMCGLPQQRGSSRRPPGVPTQVWAGLFGWSIMLGFVMAAIVQCLTIVGIPTALTLVELATFALLPFGSHIKCALNMLSNHHGAVLLDCCTCPQQWQGRF